MNQKNQLMKKITLLLACICIATLSAQENKNYDFEIPGDDFAKSWNSFGNGDHEVTLSTDVVQHGKTAVLISSDTDADAFKAIGFDIPSTFDGKKIKLTGYVKTENVTDHAGLWMRIDPEIAFDNMANSPITGTTDWKKYEIELKLKPSQAKQIVVGGLLVGQGKMWIDNLEVTVDGKPIEKANPKKLDKVQQDQEFDNGSTITLANLTENQIKNATILGKVWGFMKYHHPAIAE